MKSNSVMSTQDKRQSPIKRGAREIIKSPYNKVNVDDVILHPKVKKKRIKGFPTEIDLNTFLRQLTIRKLKKLSAKFLEEVKSLNQTVSFSIFRNVMNDIFSPQPSDSLLNLLYQRFKPLKFTDDGRELDLENQDMIIIDLMIALALLSRAISKYNDKLRIIFNFCDDDGDHCMRSDEILVMIQRLERIFCKE
jgi:hypothetical protein